MALTLPRPTGAVSSTSGSNPTPGPDSTSNPADRYAFWFFAGTLVLAIVAMTWAMLGL